MKKLREYQVGDSLPQRTWQPNQLQLRQYAEASGDFNPIHLDEDFAREAGLGGIIAQGMLTMAQVGDLLDEWIGAEGFLREFEVRFEQMVRPGDNVLCCGEVMELREDGLLCSVQVSKGQQQIVLSGRALIDFTL